MHEPSRRRRQIIGAVVATLVGAGLQYYALAFGRSAAAAMGPQGFGHMSAPTLQIDSLWPLFRLYIVVPGVPGALLFVAGITSLSKLLRGKARAIGTVAGVLLVAGAIGCAAIAWSLWTPFPDRGPMAIGGYNRGNQMAFLMALLATTWLLGGRAAIALSRRPAAPSADAAE